MIDPTSLLARPAAGTAIHDAGRIAPQVPQAGPSEGPSFAEVFAQVTQETIDSLHRAEATSIRAIQGDASTRETVEAIMAAERALHGATAVRDKIVESYKEISRMAI